MSAVAFFNTVLALILAIIIVFQFLLQRTLKKSLYYYRNSAYISGIIFCFVLMLVLYSYLIDCLTQVNTLRLFTIFREFMMFPHTFSKVALLPTLVICALIAISNVALIRHEGYRIKNMLGILLGLVFAGGFFANSYLNHFIETVILYEDGPYDIPILWVIHTYTQLFIVLMICYFEVYFISTIIMTYLASKQVPRYDKDYIIILGCSIDKKGGLLPLLKARTNRAIKYAWEQEIESGRPVKYVPSGGQGDNEIMSEASAMELYLLSHGAERNEIIAEKESRSTYENIRNSMRLIYQDNPDAKVCFATTNYHVYRSGVIARKMGIDLEGIASGTKWYFWPNGFVREFIAILSMEKKFHIISIMVLALGCLILAIMSYFVFKVYWI